MDVNLYANIIEIMFLYFQRCVDDKKVFFSLDEIKEIFETRYNWVWNNELEQGLNLLLDRYSNEEAGLVMLPELNKYIWQISAVPEKTYNYHKSVLLTYSSLPNNLELLDYFRSRDINNQQLLKDSKELSTQIMVERRALMGSEIILPF